MGMQKIHIIQDFEVPRDRVFDFLSDHERLSQIYPGAFKRIVNSRDPQFINGIGSVRRITNFPLVLDEEVTRFIYPELIEYKLIEGPFIKDHLGTMKFYDLDNGTRSRLDYTIVFEGTLPLSGFITKNLLEKLIGDGIRGLAKRFRRERDL